MDLIGKDPKKIYNNYRVCDEHFEPSSHYKAFHNRTNLMRHVMPTLFIGKILYSSYLGIVKKNWLIMK